MIKNDRVDILKYHKERVDAINTIKNLVDKWNINSDEILEFERIENHFCIEDEETYGPDYSEEALNYSIKVHDTLGLDYMCIKCLARAFCCRFSNVENLEVNGVCDGVTQNLNVTIIDDIEDYYTQREMETNI